MLIWDQLENPPGTFHDKKSKLVVSQNLSFVNVFNVIGGKIARNGRKMANSLCCDSFFETDVIIENDHIFEWI